MKSSGVSVVIVTYNNEATIRNCLSSIIKYSPQSDVIIVDNKSVDSTLEIIKSFGSKIKLIKRDKNLGFAKGSNLGAKEATGEYLVFLNPDALLLSPKSLEYLRDLLEKNAEYGILGPKLIYYNGQEQPRVRNLPTVMRAFKQYLLGIKDSYDFYQPKCQTLCEVESVIGACLIISRDLFSRISGFDEKYFLYYEDLDLCRRVRKLGYKIGFVPEVVVEHAEGISGKNQKTNKFLRDSARIYHGLFAFYLIEIILTPGRIFNKIKSFTGFT